MTNFKGILPVIAGGVAGGVIALAVASGGSSHAVTTTTVVQQPTSGGVLPTTLSTGHGFNINQIYRAASPGTVDIQVTASGGGQGGLPFFGGGAPQAQAEGSGVIYNTSGDILTDEHVVDGAQSIKVTFQDGRSVGAHVVGTDPSTDVAVIHVSAPSSELHPIPFAHSSAAQVGDPVVAIGSPFSLPETTTAGIISQVGRSIPAPNNYTITGAIQTDAPINPGNSGGPLLDASGHVLGLNDQIDTNNSTASGEGSNSGVGFAIPSDTVARIANLIIGGKPVQHAYLGVELNGTSAGGAQITSIQPGSPAQSAGLQPNDLITAIDGKAVSSTEQFIETIDTYAPGNTITLSVKRGGGSQSVKLTLGTRPESTPANQSPSQIP